MSQATDIILDGAGYMIDPGTSANPGYKRLQDGYPEGDTGRTSITDFFGGQARKLQLERDTFHPSLNVGPALGGQGVKPWGKSASTSYATMMGSERPSIDKRIPHVIVRDRIYFAIGKNLCAGPIVTPNGSMTGTLVKTYPDIITDICIYQSYGMLVAFGAAADISFRNLPAGTDTSYAATHRAFQIENWEGRSVWSEARSMYNIPSFIRMGRQDGIDLRIITHDPILIKQVGAELMIATKQSLHTFSGRVHDVMVNNPAWTSGGTAPAQIPGAKWEGDFKPFFQQGVYTEADDFVFLEGFGGRTIAWIAGGVHEMVPSGNRAGWRSTGLHGLRCFGGCIAGGYAIVSIQSHDNKNEIWAYDGNGWWRIAQQDMPASGSNGIWCWPFPTGGAGSDYRTFGVFKNADDTIQFFTLNQDPKNNTVTPLATTAEFLTPMIDAGDRDRTKVWRKLGAVFGDTTLANNVSSTASATVFLDYSVTNGRTWIQATNKLGNGNNLLNNNIELKANLANQYSKFLIVRVRWTAIADWAPTLIGVWVEHETLDNPARRRKWSLRIHARDQEVDRDGVPLLRTGRQLIAELWAKWQTDTPFYMRDIDYDDAPTQRLVRIVGITEHVAQPADASSWGDSTITLNLVEV